MSNRSFLLGLIGYPLEHSYSPSIHNSALESLNLAGSYRLYPIKPLPVGETDLVRLIQRIRSGELDGINVTIPHKKSVMRYLDGTSLAAQAIGAVNTILLRGGELIGENTDAPGFLYDLKHAAHSHFSSPALSNGKHTIQRQAIILGAGGAARAVVYALSKSGWRIIIAARRVEKAIELEKDIKRVVPEGEIFSITLNRETLFDLQLRDCLVVNATSAGMFPNIEVNPWPFGLPLPAGSFVYDLVYNPSETDLLGQAQRENIPCRGGMGMLVEQAALAFELWTGYPAPREVMHKSVLKILY